MKIARARGRDGRVRHGILTDGELRWLDDTFDFEAPRAGEQRCSLEEITLLAPVSPGKLIGIGRNYAAHAKELGNEAPESPLLFLKPPSAVIGPGESIILPGASSQVHYEGELAIVIGRSCRAIRADEWLEFVLGFTVANDVTARDLQKKDVQFTRGKGFDTFCPLGPWIETDLEAGDLAVVTRLNGEVVQSGRTSQMIFGCGEIMEFVSGIMTLEPGDVILTGTPEGVGALSEGDEIEVEVEGIGVLQSSVAR